MTRRLKIKIVAGTLRDPAMLKVWDELSIQHSVEIFAIDAGTCEVLTTTPVVLFPQIPDMPGFCRDLDRHLLGADLVVGIDSSKLYTFQALRAARKLGIPFACVVHDYDPLVYQKYTNIRAIQQDIYQNSDIFLATSRRAAQLLQMEGVSAAKIVRTSATTDPEKFVYSEASASRFRNYVQIPESCILVTLKTSLAASEPAASIVQGMRLALNQMPAELRDRVRFLICGSGEASSSLKYQISDLGMGGQTMLLAQDSTPFLGDLLSASDVVIDGKRPKSTEPEILPWHMISAATSGAKVILPRGTIADDWLSGLLVSRLDDFSAMDIAIALSAAINSVVSENNHTNDNIGECGNSAGDRRRAVGDLAARSLSPKAVAAAIDAVAGNLCRHDERIFRRDGLISFIERHQVAMTYKDASDVLVKCEEIREFSSTCEIEQHSEVLRIRGDALATLSRGEEAVSAFEEALRSHAGNFHALRGLGFLAWHGHSHEDALSFFKRGLAVSPNDYQCLVGVGLVYRRLKMLTESLFWLQKAVGVGGLDSPSLNLVVQACLENPEEPEALGALQLIRESFGDHPNLTTAIEKLQSHQ
jgi:glycosyltransferase involved in cell wall biosynthesis